jgi:hypothetical protein
LLADRQIGQSNQTGEIRCVAGLPRVQLAGHDWFGTAGNLMPVAPANFPADTVLLPGWGVSFFGSRLTIMKSICNFCWSAAVWMTFNFEKVVVT